MPPSLQNMFKELKTDCSCSVPGHGDLQKVRRSIGLLPAVNCQASWLAEHRRRVGNMSTCRACFCFLLHWALSSALCQPVQPGLLSKGTHQQATALVSGAQHS